jgi:hypothetical protein
MGFRKGQKVVCVVPRATFYPRWRDLWRRFGPDPKRGRVYTVAAAGEIGRAPGNFLALAELPKDFVWAAFCFRRAIEDELAALSAIAADPDAPLKNAPEAPQREPAPVPEARHLPPRTPAPSTAARPIEGAGERDADGCASRVPLAPAEEGLRG